MMDLRSVITSLPNTTLTITRTGAGSYVKGIHTGGTPTSVSVIANVWNATDRESLLLPETIRTRETLGITATTELYQADEDTKTQADRFTYNGKVYEIQHVGHYDQIAQFWYAVATKVDY